MGRSPLFVVYEPPLKEEGDRRKAVEEFLHEIFFLTGIFKIHLNLVAFLMIRQRCAFYAFIFNADSLIYFVFYIFCFISESNIIVTRYNQC